MLAHKTNFNPTKLFYQGPKNMIYIVREKLGELILANDSNY